MSRSSNEILMGPVKKNKALRDVEFVLHCLAGVPFSSDTAQEYAITPAHAISAPRLFENSQGQILAECPNGKTYNLSIALRNANFEYFCLTSALHTPLLIALQNLTENRKTQPILARKLIGGDKARPIFKIEENSMVEYTGAHSYKEMNALLRGQSMKQYNLDETQLKKLLVSSLLAISGANKNVSPVIDFELELASEMPTPLQKNKLYVRQQGQDIQYIVMGMQDWQTIASSEFKTGTPDLSDLNAARSSILTITSVRGHTPTPVETKTINRFIDNMPAGLSSEMMISSLPQHLSGLMSFSESNYPDSFFTDRTLRIKVNQGRTNSIAAISINPKESEVLHPPGSLRCLPVDAHSKYDEIYAEIAYGPATEKNDHYLSESALSWAYEKHLRYPYKEAYEVHDAIYRPNHALAHHVRVTSYTNAVINYFAAFAANEGFKNFCAGLSPYDIEIIKILTAFSKTGRESECSFKDDKVRFQRDKAASAENMSHFMKQYLELSEKELDTYKEIVRMMGDPSYHGNEEKHYIAHIITLAHKLDLRRCYGATQWQDALKIYHSGDLIQNTAEQITAFDALKELALCTIAETGDGYLVLSDFSTNSDQFKPCNTDLLYCLDRCVLARNLIHVTDERQRARLKSIDRYTKYENILKNNHYASYDTATLSDLLQMMRPSLDQKMAILKHIIDNSVWPHDDIKQLLIIPEWNDDDKQHILASIAMRLIKIAADSQRFFCAWTAEQVQQILAAAVAKIDCVMITIDVLKQLLKAPELLNIPKWSNEQQQKISDAAVDKADRIITHSVDVVALLKMPGLSDKQKQQILGAGIAKLDRIMTECWHIAVLLKIPEWSDEQKQQILATAFAKTNRFLVITSYVLELLEIPGWSDEQKQKILDAALAKGDRLIMSGSDVLTFLKIPALSDEQKQQILAVSFAKVDRLIRSVCDVSNLLKIPEWSDEQKQQILDAALVKVDCLMTTATAHGVEQFLKIPEWSDEQKQQILAVVVAKAAHICTNVDDVLTLLNIPGLTEQHKRKILDAAVRAGFVDIAKMISTTQTGSGPGFFKVSSSVTDGNGIITDLAREPRV